MVDEIVKQEITKDKRLAPMIQFFQYVKEMEWDILVLVTRKGFWIYHLLCEVNEGIKMPDRKICSDRYLMKSVDNSAIYGKKVCLIDDTLNHGYNLFRFFCVLKKAGAASIIPFVYARSIEYPNNLEGKDEICKIYYEVFKTDGICNEEAKHYWMEFLGLLKSYQYMSQDNISRLCIFETELFQKALCPLVVDLPMLVSKQEGGKVLADSFLLREEQFQKLCQETEQWKYVPNIYNSRGEGYMENAVKGALDIPIQCNYFECKDLMTDTLYKNFLLDMTIKCKYNYNEEKGYSIVFTPFAIVRSWEKDELGKAFELLAEGTEYAVQIKRLKEKSDEESIWIAMLRFVIYILSLYVGEKFRAHLKATIGVDSGYDWDIIQQNSDEEFISALRTVMVDKGLEDKVKSLVAWSEAQEIKKEDPARNTIKQYTVQDAYDMLQEIMVKPNNTLELEQIERNIVDRYVFKDDASRRRAVVDIILIALEISVLGNHIMVEGNTVKRTFRSGENSSLLLGADGWMCYSCAEILYTCAGREWYESLKNEYFDLIEEKMHKMGLFDSKVDESVFRVYRKWFCNISKNDLHGQIMGKRFLLEQLDEESKDLREYAKVILNDLIKEK